VAFELSGIGPERSNSQRRPHVGGHRLTLRPLGRLRYSTRYTLTLSSTIVDRDSGEPGDPKELLAHSGEFTTYPPQVIGGTEEKFPSPGLVVLDDRAYLVHNLFVRGRIRTFDISNPDQPSEVPEATNSVDGRPVDIGGIDEGVVSSGRLIAVGTTATNHSLPSNVQLFDASGDRMARVGVASLTSSAVEGTLVRFVPRERYLYALTQYRGVQVLDMAQAKENYLREAADPTRLFNMMRDLNTDGRGFGHDAVVRTVPVKANETTHWILADLDAGDYTIDGVQQPLAMVTGQIGLGVVNTVTGDVRQVPLLQTADASMRLTGRDRTRRVGTADVAVVAGPARWTGRTYAALFVVSLANPLVPQVLGAVSLMATSSSRISHRRDPARRHGHRGRPDDAVVVSLTDLARPAVVGAAANVGGAWLSAWKARCSSARPGRRWVVHPLGGLHRRPGQGDFITSVKENPSSWPRTAAAWSRSSCGSAPSRCQMPWRAPRSRSAATERSCGRRQFRSTPRATAGPHCRPASSTPKAP
jgi:hypothetical protein